MDSTDTDLVPDTDVVEQTSAETPSEDSDSSPEEASDDSSALEASEEDDLLPLPPRKSLAECRVGDVLEARVVGSCTSFLQSRGWLTLCRNM